MKLHRDVRLSHSVPFSGLYDNTHLGLFVRRVCDNSDKQSIDCYEPRGYGILLSGILRYIHGASSQ